jgi:hypothetical protein
MIINLARRAGDELVLEEIDDGVMFEGGQPQPGVIVTFAHEGREISARITEVTTAPDDPSGKEPIVTLIEIDRPTLDRESEIALDELPPETDLFDPGAGGTQMKLPPRKPG